MKSVGVMRGTVIFALTLCASLVSAYVTPTYRMADRWAAQPVSKMLPIEFGEWREDPKVIPIAVDLAVAETLEQTYSEIVSRTYVDPHGRRIMLSVAYGRDQRGEGRAHYPEVCYPAQGFQVGKGSRTILPLHSGELAVNQLVATHGARNEPIIYWMMVGDEPVLDSIAHKTAILLYGLKGEIADGLLFRISSVDTDTVRAFNLQREFILSLYKNLPQPARQRFFGAPSTS